MDQSKFRTLTICTLLLLTANLLSGCLALELGLEAEAGVGAAELASTRALLGADEVLTLEHAVTVGEGGALTIANEEGVNALLEKVTVREANGGPPRLYAESRSAPFGEVYTKSGRIRLLEGSGRFITIHEDIFSVREGEVNVMASPKTFSRIVGSVRQGQLMVRLAEENGWYQVRIIKDAQVAVGWVNSLTLFPVLLASDHGRLSYFGKNGPYGSPSRKRDYRVFVNPEMPKKDLAILILDQDGNSLSAFANAVADDYLKKGRSTTIGLVNPKIANIPEFDDVFNGTQSIYRKMELAKYSRYLMIGKIIFNYRKGQEAQGTIICTATMSVHIIITETGSLFRSLPIPAGIGNGVTDEQARENCMQRLYLKFTENANF